MSGKIEDAVKKSPVPQSNNGVKSPIRRVTAPVVQPAATPIRHPMPHAMPPIASKIRCSLTRLRVWRSRPVWASYWASCSVVSKFKTGAFAPVFPLCQLPRVVVFIECHQGRDGNQCRCHHIPGRNIQIARLLNQPCNN